jgi:hypothetical protein
MMQLDSWLRDATRRLSKDSAARVRAEILEHYELAREASIDGGATVEEAERFALAALGDAKVANLEYRKVLLTSGEARMLRDARWEARVVGSRPWLWWLLLPIPSAALLAAIALVLMGAGAMARVVSAGAMGMAFLFVAPLLPIYTISRARTYRRVKWVVTIGLLVLAFGPHALKWSGLLLSCLWPLVWIEMTRASIRRKLRVSEWPKPLYL